jgi:hypothetical protein
LAERGAAAGQSPYFIPIAVLAEQVKSATTLVDMAWSVGKAVQAGYEVRQADHACSQYLQRYEKKHASIKILGMSEPIELASIYTEVRVISPEFLRGYRTQGELQELFLQKERSLASYDFNRDVARPALQVTNDEKHRFLNLLGAPGAGKSTFLHYVGLMALRNHRHTASDQGRSDHAGQNYRFNLLPVLLELRGLRKDRTDFTVLIDEELHNNGFPANFGRAALQAGGLLVLLDGVDEVPADKLDKTIQGIHELIDRHPECRYVTSCRTAFYKNFFTRFTDALLTDFTDDQIHNLIENWFRSDRDRELGIAATLWDLLKDTKHQATRELARTPLLATFLCLVYDHRQKLPTNRAELYGDALRILLEDWAASKRVHGAPVFPGLSTKRELLMLEEIAGTAYERERYFFTAQELSTAIEKFLGSGADGPDNVDGRKVVEEIERKQGLLVQRAHDKYSFSHLTLHEYLAACHYYKSGRSREIIKKTLIEERWREVQLLLAGLQEPDADDFLIGMATETADRVTSEALKGLLSWAERIVSLDRSPRRTAGRRALMTGFALSRAVDRALGSALGRAVERELELDLDRSRDLNLARDLSRARDLAVNIARDIDLDRDLEINRDLDGKHDSDLELELARALGINLAGTRTLARELARVLKLDLDGSSDLEVARARGRVRVRDLDLVFVIMKHGLIAAERSGAKCVAARRTLCRYLMDPQAPADAVLQELEIALDFPVLAPAFSASDARQCLEFLICTRRILECREAAEWVTQAGWDRVCERLIALPTSQWGVPNVEPCPQAG